MRFDPSKPLTGLTAEPINMLDGQPGTLGSALVMALLTPTQSEGEITGVEKMERYRLAMRIMDGIGEATVEEVAMLKKVSGMAFTPLVVGRIWDALDPPNLLMEARDAG